jgi:RND family efflux transporter MFP subunit
MYRTVTRTAPRRGLPIWSVAIVALTNMAAIADVPFPTARVELELTPRERIWDGTVEAVHQATVSAQTSGRVAEIRFDVNDFVEAGAMIMRFTDTEQRAALNQARAAVEEAEARFTEAQSDFTRIAAMFENQTVSRARYEQAQANFDAATARLQAARANATAAEEQIEYTVVRAPYAGIVSARHVEVGELVTPGQPLMSGLSLQMLRVNVAVPQSMINPIREIGRAQVYVGDMAVPAQALTFFPVADPATNTFSVRVDLPETEAPMFPGMFVKVGFIIGEAQRLLVPAQAIVRRSELTAVYVADLSRDTVSLRQIRAGRSFGDKVEILAGLEAGESVALDPVAAGIYLKAGQQASGSDEPTR